MQGAMGSHSLETEMAWVQENSPLLDGYVRERLGDGSLRGLKVAVILHLEAKTGFLATVLQDAGAEVIIGGCNPRTTRRDVAAILSRRGMQVCVSEDESREGWEKDLHRIAELGPDIVVDDGAELVTRMIEHHPEQFARVRGISEKTATGTRRLRALEEEGSVRLPPSLIVDSARCKHLFDNRHATGQTVLLALLKLTNTVLTGKQIAVLGYGWVGRGLASYARALGARVAVIEIDPVRALEAHMSGMYVGDYESVLPECDFVITATGGGNALTAEQMGFLKDGVLLANAGHSDNEIDLEGLEAVATSREASSRYVTRYVTPSGVVNLLCGAALVNISGGAGNQIDVIDLSFSVTAIGAQLVAQGRVSPGVHYLPAQVDDDIARARLDFLGVTIPEVAALTSQK